MEGLIQQLEKLTATHRDAQNWFTTYNPNSERKHVHREVADAYEQAIALVRHAQDIEP